MSDDIERTCTTHQWIRWKALFSSVQEQQMTHFKTLVPPNKNYWTNWWPMRKQVNSFKCNLVSPSVIDLQQKTSKIRAKTLRGKCPSSLLKPSLCLDVMCSDWACVCFAVIPSWRERIKIFWDNLMNKAQLVARYRPHYSLINIINNARESPALLLKSPCLALTRSLLLSSSSSSTWKDQNIKGSWSCRCRDTQCSLSILPCFALSPLWHANRLHHNKPLIRSGERTVHSLIRSPWNFCSSSHLSPALTLSPSHGSIVADIYG